MAARKNLKNKINNYLKDFYPKEFTGFEIEQLYIRFGGAVCKNEHGRFGRVAADTMRSLLSTIQADKIGNGILKAKYVYSPNEKMTLHEFSKRHPYFYEKITCQLRWHQEGAWPGAWWANSIFEIAKLVNLRFQFTENYHHLNIYSNNKYFPGNSAFMSTADLYAIMNNAFQDFSVAVWI